MFTDTICAVIISGKYTYSGIQKSHPTLHITMAFRKVHHEKYTLSTQTLLVILILALLLLTAYFIKRTVHNSLRREVSSLQNLGRRQRRALEKQCAKLKDGVHDDDMLQLMSTPKPQANSKTQKKKARRAAFGPESRDEDLLVLSALSGGRISVAPRTVGNHWEEVKKSERKEVKIVERIASDEKSDDVKESTATIESPVENNVKEQDTPTIVESKPSLLKPNVKASEQHKKSPKKLRKQQKETTPPPGSSLDISQTSQTAALNNTIKILMQSLSTSQKASQKDAATMHAMTHQIHTLQSGMAQISADYGVLEESLREVCEERDEVVRRVCELEEELSRGYYEGVLDEYIDVDEVQGEANDQESAEEGDKDTSDQATRESGDDLLEKPAVYFKTEIEGVRRTASLIAGMMVDEPVSISATAR